MYSYKTKSGVTIQADTWIQVINTASQLGDVIHWSQNEGKFYALWEMNEQHLYNVIKLRLDEGRFNPSEFANFIKESPYVKELLSRY